MFTAFLNSADGLTVLEDSLHSTPFYSAHGVITPDGDPRSSGMLPRWLRRSARPVERADAEHREVAEGQSCSFFATFAGGMAVLISFFRHRLHDGPGAGSRRREFATFRTLRYAVVDSMVFHQ